jgi:hypothetical protein
MDSIVASRFARFNERLCVAIEHGRDNDFPAENDFFACVEIAMSEYCPHKLHMVGYCVVWLILVDSKSQTFVSRALTSKGFLNLGERLGNKKNKIRGGTKWRSKHKYCRDDHRPAN